MTLARKLARQRERAALRASRKDPDARIGTLVAERGGNAEFDAVVYCLLRQVEGDVELDLSAYRPGKAAAFWRRVAELEGADLAFLRGLAAAGSGAGPAPKKAVGASQAPASGPAVNLRI
ncbi:hypothetical protein [Deinococcus aerophilus]|uniref:Uncharacterized protein n=1 Tax=Deinococcus aerophilus TaxID=522488 RepID=A0ABQ2GX37_9DEIO|nr:hypothetical protein [Deinococcus aerophilus]GGM16392.1 hypothetical protein GCM10010841_25920 [Deinococcus aerophilus]